MRRRGQESGFALLLVFALAAALAISLYMALPRAAFESQRVKEQILIDRGEQYKRAVQLYYTKNKKYPQTMDELEKTGDIRFLRKRYLDPISGKDEWRLVHTNGTILTDSLIKKKEEKKENLNTFITEGPSMGSSNGPDTGGVNLALRRRASEQGPAPDPNAPPPPPPPFPQALPPAPGDANVPPQGTQPGQQPSGNPFNAATPAPGTQPAAPPNEALGMIQKILTSPRQPPSVSAQMAKPQSCPSGSCIAGVASKAEMPSIKIYNERQKYNEWEFVYEIAKDKRLQKALGIPAGGIAPQPQGAPGGLPGLIGNNNNNSINGPIPNPIVGPGTTRPQANGGSGGSSGGFITIGPSLGSAPPLPPPPPAANPANGQNPNSNPNPNPNQNPQLPGFPPIPPTPQPQQPPPQQPPSQRGPV